MYTIRFSRCRRFSDIHFVTALFLFIFCYDSVFGYFQQCSIEDGGGYCPLGGTCCARPDGGSSCIPTVLGNSHATCCNDNRNVSGCPVGYTCEINPTDEYHYCQGSVNVTDGLLQILPRYKLCYESMGDADVFDLHGWPMAGGLGIFPYYSSHGSVNVGIVNNTRLNDITNVIIVMHGALRNADDLFCSLLVGINEQSKKKNSIDPANILLIAPRFAVNTDPDIYTTLVDHGEVLQWEVNDGGFGGSWRYGANAVWPPYAVHLSSYDVIDIMVNQLLTLPKVNHIAVIGHSAGGQFVQRWSLLTNTWIESKVTSVVANPSSYGYLTNERRAVYQVDDDGPDWIIPNDPKCPGYNQWMFGFDPDQIIDGKPIYSVSYVQNVINQYGFEWIKKRFATRYIIYLGASLDHCNVTHHTNTSWCSSHGLQGSCSDEWEGENRLERHWNYWNMLLRVYKDNVNDLNQYRDIVIGVGHDYSLVFNSDVGQRATFDPYSYSSGLSTKKKSQQKKQYTATRMVNKELPIKFFIRDLPHH